MFITTWFVTFVFGVAALVPAGWVAWEFRRAVRAAFGVRVHRAVRVAVRFAFAFLTLLGLLASTAAAVNRHYSYILDLPALVENVSRDQTAHQPMQYLVRDDVPVSWALADAYATADRWFCALMGPTLPNRYYWHGGSSEGKPRPETVDLGESPSIAAAGESERYAALASLSFMKIDLRNPPNFAEQARASAQEHIQTLRSANQAQNHEITKTNNELLDRLLEKHVRFVFFNRGELRQYFNPYFLKRFRTVEEAERKVSADRIIKSIVLVGSDKKPILAILPAKNKISYKKIKTLLKVKDVRLAQPDEVLEHSGYPVGGVPPFNKISRILLDPTVQRNARSIAGGGDPDKLVEFETRDMLEFLDPIVADFSV